MKLTLRILLGAIVIAVIGFGILSLIYKPLSKEAVYEKIEKHLTKVVNKHDSISSVLLTIHSEQTGYSEQFAVGTKNRTSDQPAQIDSPYHSASIGKTMNAAVYGMLVDEGKVSYEDRIDRWLDDDVLEGLFRVDGTNYSHQVTVRHLLSHTSGVGDYFEGPVISGKTMLEQIHSHPDLSFTPEQLLAFTRDNQQPVGKPGEQFYYSDTGYVLLGLILEAIEQKPYADILDDRIFNPLGMSDSYLFVDNAKSSDILGLYINGIDYSHRKALSVDWSGGGVITTMQDLLTFMKALEYGALLSDDAYSQMTGFTHRYEKGIYYGIGMMYFDFSELSFLLGSMTDVYGAVGATGTYALYDKENETFFIANFGSLDFAEKGIEELVKIRMIYDRMKVE